VAAHTFAFDFRCSSPISPLINRTYTHTGHTEKCTWNCRGKAIEIGHWLLPFSFSSSSREIHFFCFAVFLFFSSRRLSSLLFSLSPALRSLLLCTFFSFQVSRIRALFKCNFRLKYAQFRPYSVLFQLPATGPAFFRNIPQFTCTLSYRLTQNSSSKFQDNATHQRPPFCFVVDVRNVRKYRDI